MKECVDPRIRMRERGGKGEEEEGLGKDIVCVYFVEQQEVAKIDKGEDGGLLEHLRVVPCVSRELKNQLVVDAISSPHLRDRERGGGEGGYSHNQIGV